VIQIGPHARDAKDTRDQKGEGDEVTAFRPFRARYIRLGGYLGFRCATPQAITLRAFSPNRGQNKLSSLFSADSFCGWGKLCSDPATSHFKVKRLCKNARKNLLRQCPRTASFQLCL
jgi:hypothetical protein